MGYFNYHTHTTYCDGKSTPEEIVLEAIRLGLDTIGFSGHAPCPGAEDYSVRDLEGYNECIERLKDKYSDKIRILRGIERDIFAYDDDHDYDYVIGAFHNLYVNGKFYATDRSPAIIQQSIDELCGGNAEAFAIRYMEFAKDIARVTGCDIIAHMDLVTKFNGDGENKLFDVRSEAYLASVKEAIDENMKLCKLFEINAGAISRGWRKTPYPDPAILDIIHDAGGKITFGSDSHAKETLLLGFDQAEELAKKHGFGTLTRLDLK